MSSARPEDDLDRREFAGSGIPASLISLIGRTRDVEVVSDSLRRCRLLTVTGPGGVGKTSLATEVARRHLPRRLDGVWLIDLADGPSTAEVATEPARVLGLQAGSRANAVDALRRYLAERDASWCSAIAST